jgi:hypothetical protein
MFSTLWNVKVISLFNYDPFTIEKHFCPAIQHDYIFRMLLMKMTLNVLFDPDDKGALKGVFGDLLNINILKFLCGLKCVELNMGLPQCFETKGDQAKYHQTKSHFHQDKYSESNLYSDHTYIINLLLTSLPVIK